MLSVKLSSSGRTHEVKGASPSKVCLTNGTVCHSGEEKNSESSVMESEIFPTSNEIFSDSSSEANSTYKIDSSIPAEARSTFEDQNKAVE